MKRKTNYLLNKQDEEIIHLFTELDVSKNFAKTLTYISQVDECRSSDIEQATNLLQPQVSLTIQELKEKGWIKKQEVKKKGKGRPVHRYQLSQPLPEILKSFEKEKIQEIETVKKNLSELENILLK